MLVEKTSSGSTLKVTATVTLGDVSVKRDGRVFFRFDVPVLSTFDAVEAAKFSGKMLVCIAEYLSYELEQAVQQATRVGCVVFAGLSIKKQGDSVLVIETHEDALEMTFEQLRLLREKEMRLSLIYIPG
jgi:hypothetical protein